MLWTIFVILLVLWLLGLVTSYTLGGFIHTCWSLRWLCSSSACSRDAGSFNDSFLLL
jgi:hypothetical protein